LVGVNSGAIIRQKIGYKIFGRPNSDIHACWINPNVAKAGGLQRPGVKDEAVVVLPQFLDNAVSEVLRLSRRVNNMAR